MLRSIRRIANMLAGVGALALSLSVLSTISFHCGSEGASCLGAVLWGVESGTGYVTSLDTSQSTIAYSQNATTGLLNFDGINTVVQLTSVYALFVAVLVLVVLELFQLHYTRMLLRKRSV